LRVIPCIGDINDGNLQKFEQNLKRLVNYKRLDPGYLDKLVIREWYISMFNRLNITQSGTYKLIIAYLIYIVLQYGFINNMVALIQQTFICVDGMKKYFWFRYYYFFINFSVPIM